MGCAMEFCDENNCIECCFDVKVPLLNEDINRITQHGFYDVYFVEEDKGIKTLRKREDGSCVFLDKSTGGCEIYSARPEKCKLNPYCICHDNLEPHVDHLCKHSRYCQEDPNQVKRMHEYINQLQKEIEWRRKTGFF
jgi:Fe-S-cluster containining protein